MLKSIGIASIEAEKVDAFLLSEQWHECSHTWAGRVCVQVISAMSVFLTRMKVLEVWDQSGHGHIAGAF